MFMNRWRYRREIVEENCLTPAEEREVFHVLRPLLGQGEAARYLECDADEVIGSVRRGRPSLGKPLFVGEEEGRSMAPRQVNSWADSVKKEEPEAVHAAPPLLMDEKQSARMLGVSRRTLFELNKRGVLSSRRIGRRKLYLVSDIESFARGEVA